MSDLSAHNALSRSRGLGAMCWLFLLVIAPSQALGQVNGPQDMPIGWMHPELGTSSTEKWRGVLGPGNLVETLGGQPVWVGQSRSNPNNRQFVVLGGDSGSDVLIRLDLDGDKVVLKSRDRE